MHLQQALHDASEFASLYKECHSRMEFLDLSGLYVASKPQTQETQEEYGRICELRATTKAEMNALVASFVGRHIVAKDPVLT